MKRFSVSAISVVLLLAAGARADEPAALAKKARAVLDANCHRCHGQDGNIEGGFNYVLDARQLVTRLSNWKSGLGLTDCETCYKMIRRDFIQQIAAGLIERGFGVELELTFKLARLPAVRFYERPVSYVGRSWAEGKKIGIKDGLWALWCILRY